MATLAPVAPGALPGTPPAPAFSVRHLGPNWYAGVMGTAVVASAGVALEIPAGLLVPVWVLASLMLLSLLAARVAHWVRHADQARAHLDDPSVAPFYGCLSMALLAVGAATLSAGAEIVGVRAAVVADAVLWSAGTVAGLAAAVAVPYLMITRHRVEAGSASPVWLLPVVAPMVSAALGPQLAPRLPAGQWREAMVLGSLALFGMSLLMVLLLLPLVFARLLHHGPLPPALTPLLFLVLGPLGQSTTAASALADASATIPAGFAVLYGVPVLGFALLWIALAGALVLRAARRGMGFSMTWWAFTFPVGTCVTGAAGLAEHTGLDAFRWLACALYALLVTAWLAAGTGTVRGLRAGTLPAAAR